MGMRLSLILLFFILFILFIRLCVYIIVYFLCINIPNNIRNYKCYVKNLMLLLALVLAAANLNSAKLSLTSGVAILLQTLLLLGGAVLLCRNNATVLVKNKVSLGKTAGGLVSGSVPNLGTRAFQLRILLSVDVIKTVVRPVNALHSF